MHERRGKKSEPPIKTSHVVIGLIFVVVILSSISSSHDGINVPKLKFKDIDYYVAIVTYNITPYAVKNCLTLNPEERLDYVIRRDSDAISVTTSILNSECSVYSRSIIEYHLACVQITKRGWQDNCGVLSSETRKKLSGAYNVSG